MNTLLVGPRGCGKSTIGRLLALRARLRFVDLDARVLDGFAESSVHEVWSRHGEAAWRDAEARLLEECLAADGQVIALGGGVPMIEDARRRIERQQRAGAARVVYLRCTPGELARRLREQPGDRPSLTGADPAEEIAGVLAQRQPTYERLADRVLDVTAMTAGQAAEALTDLAAGR